MCEEFHSPTVGAGALITLERFENPQHFHSCNRLEEYSINIHIKHGGKVFNPPDLILQEDENPLTICMLKVGNSVADDIFL